MDDASAAPSATEARRLRGHAHYASDDADPLVDAAAAAVTGTIGVHELMAVLRASTVYCEAPDRPGVMTAETPSGPVVPVYTSLAQLAAARGPVAWFSTTGGDLLPQLPAGHDMLLDPAGPSPVLLRAALWCDGGPPS